MKQNPKQTLIYQKSGIFSSTFFKYLFKYQVTLKFVKNKLSYPCLTSAANSFRIANFFPV